MNIHLYLEKSRFRSDDPKESVPVERQNVVIFSNGSVYWYVARIYSVICELNVSISVSSYY